MRYSRSVNERGDVSFDPGVTLLFRWQSRSRTTEQGLTQLGIARLIGMTDKAVRQWETQTRQSTKGARRNNPDELTTQARGARE